MSAAPLPPHPPLTKYYDDPSRREKYVRDIFDESSPWYDWAARFLSFGSGQWYRRDALVRAGIQRGMRLLDLATGTGVVARAASDLLDRRDVVGVDPSIGMLHSGDGAGLKVQGVAESLPLRSESVDAITIGFAMRHFADLSAVFSECHRVLRPGGRLLILEITSPESRPARALLGVYMGKVVPAAVRIRSGSAKVAELFRYYWETTRDCVRPQVILGALHDAGFESPARNVVLGIFSEYSATKHSSGAKWVL